MSDVLEGTAGAAAVAAAGAGADAAAVAAAAAAAPGFEDFWALRAASARMCAPSALVSVGTSSPAARYHELVVAPPGGRELRARYVRPASDEPCGLVLCFPDFSQGVRGWHHLTRFVALGLAAVMLDARSLGWESLDVAAGAADAPQGLALAGAYTDALRLSAAALKLPGIDLAHVRAWGEGVGGACALCVSALLGDETWRCAVANPVPAGMCLERDARVAAGPLAGITRHFRQADPTRSDAEGLARALAYVDAAGFAALVRGSLLVGTGLLDEVSPPEGQDALVRAAGDGPSARVRQVRYPRHGHERINEFENELVGFLA